MKRMIAFFILVMPLFVSAQKEPQVTLEQVQRWAAENFPLVKQKLLAQESASATQANLSNNYLPQFNISGQATWQNEVTAVPFNLPGTQIDPLSNDQYRLLLDINQLLYDGGQTRIQQKLTGLQANLRQQEVDINLHALREKINNLYLNILLLDEQRQLQNIVVTDLETGISKVKAQVDNGTAYRSYLALLQSEQLKAMQRMQEIDLDRQGLIETLSLLTNQSFTADVKFLLPEIIINPDKNIAMNRPELKFYKLKDSLLQMQDEVTIGKVKPRISLFASSGYGRPGLNMLKNEFSPFITTGVRMQWNLSGFYNLRKEKSLNEIARKEVKAVQENFVLQTQAEIIKQGNTAQKYYSMLKTDDEIIRLKKQVKDASLAQLEQGIITASDYLREVHAEDAARQQKELHKLQQIQAMLTLQNAAGN